MAKLYYYYAAMNAGKSTMLLQSSYNYRERGMDTILFTPSIDTRYGLGKISSRLGIDSIAIPFNDQLNMLDYVAAKLKEPECNLKCVLVDEAQFLTKEQVGQLTDISDRLKVPVLAYGLRTDFQGEPFPGSLYLLAWADELIEIKTICHCGRKAIMNMRIDDNDKPVRVGEQVAIGGNSRYVATCRQHFKAGVAKSGRPKVAVSNKASRKKIEVE